MLFDPVVKSLLCIFIFLFSGTILAQPIDQQIELEVNGTKQWIYVRGNSKKPIILFVHGGPGFPFTPIARAFEEPFKKDFLIIHWDQRGIGKSFKSTDFSNGFTIGQFVQDGISVTNQIKKRFGPRRILLVGHSWGTILGAKMALLHPELFHAYISVGTNSDPMDSETYRYNFIKNKLEREGSIEELQILNRIGPPPWTSRQNKEWSTVLGKYVPFEWMWGPIPVSEVEKASMTGVQAGDYSIEELEDTFLKAMPQSFGKLSKEYYSFSASIEVPKLKVPVYFLQGELDFNTPSHIVKKYFDALEAPNGKFWREIENHGHMVLYEAPDQFLELLLEAVN